MPRNEKNNNCVQTVSQLTKTTSPIGLNVKHNNKKAVTSRPLNRKKPAFSIFKYSCYLF